jgi:hypothetical protein
VIGLVAPLAVIPPGFDVTVYDCTGLPPLSSGGAKLTTAKPSLGAADTLSGGEIAVFDVQWIGIVPADSGPLPNCVVACTVKTYVSPFVIPVIRTGLVVVVALSDPSVDETVYDWIGRPPVLTGGPKLTLMPPGTTVAATSVGAVGGVAGSTGNGPPGPLLPARLVAYTVT